MKPGIALSHRLLQFATKLKPDDEMVIDAAVLARLHASGFLPEVWMPDEQTETRLRVIAQ